MSRSFKQKLLFPQLLPVTHQQPQLRIESSLRSAISLDVSEWQMPSCTSINSIAILDFFVKLVARIDLAQLEPFQMETEPVSFYYHPTALIKASETAEPTLKRTRLELPNPPEAFKVPTVPVTKTTLLIWRDPYLMKQATIF